MSSSSNEKSCARRVFARTEHGGGNEGEPTEIDETRRFENRTVQCSKGETKKNLVSRARENKI